MDNTNICTDTVENIKQLAAGISAEYTGCALDLYNAAKAFLVPDEADAEERLVKLYASTPDEGIKDAAAQLLFAILASQGRFDELAQFGIPRNQEDETAIQFYGAQGAQASLTTQVDRLKLIPNEPGWGIISVTINGVEVELMVDTGAAITVVNESTARKCGLILGDSVEGENAVADKVTVTGSVIDKISFGQTEFQQQPCMVIADEMIDFGEFKISGTVGWELIRQLKWVFDFKAGYVSISAPQAENVERNMAYDFYPLVKVQVNDNQVWMGFDSGANSSGFGRSMKPFVHGLRESTIEAAGAGSSAEERGFIVPEAKIGIAGNDIRLADVNLWSERDYGKSAFFITPGVLGMDIVVGGKFLTIDWFNRHLSVG